MDIISIVTGLLSNIFTKDFVQKLVDDGVLKELLDKVTPATILPICVTILGYGQQDPQIRKAAIDAIAQMAESVPDGCK